MKPSLTYSALVVVLALGLAGCDGTEFSGDGTLTDSGSSTANDRYILRLGEVSEDRHSFRFGGLPREELAFGLSIVEKVPSGRLCDSKPIAASVSLSLTESSGAVSFSEAKPLDEWTWSCSSADIGKAFAYVRNASGGSIVLPDAGMEYFLEVAVSSPISELFEIEVIAKGGGWK